MANITDIKIQRRDENKNLGKKVNLRSFSLYHYYSYSLTLSSIVEPSWSWIPRDHIQEFPVSKREIKFSRGLVYALHKKYNLAILRRSRTKKGKEMY